MLHDPEEWYWDDKNGELNIFVGGYHVFSVTEYNPEKRQNYIELFMKAFALGHAIGGANNAT